MATIEKVIRGQKVTTATFRNLQKQINNLPQALTVAANYGAFCLVFHNGPDMLNNLIASPALTLSTGKPSKLGKEVIAYVLAHCGQFVVFDYKSGKFAQKKFKGKEAKANKEAARGFINPETGEFTARPDENGSAPENVDFALTFEQWRTFTKPAEEKAPASMKAATIVGQLEKLAAAFDEGRVAATAEEAAAMLDHLTKVHGLAVQLAAKLANEASAALAAIDAEKVHELADSGRKGKSARVGGKVAAV